MNKKNLRTSKGGALTLAGALLFLAAPASFAQEPGRGDLSAGGARQSLTLKRAVALALQNSRDLALARVQQNVAEKAAGFQRAQFRPNLYTGSGAAYTSGFPQTVGGAAPSVLSLSYVQTLFNPPLRGHLHAAEERAQAQSLEVEKVRDSVIARTALAYLELVKVRHSLELLRRERESAQRILDVTRERLGAGVELPIEVTRSQLSAARIEQRIVQLESREEALEGELRSMTGFPPERRINVAAEDLPRGTDQPVPELLELAMASNLGLKQAEIERRAREHRLKGEHGGYWPTLDLVAQYSIFSRVNNFDEFFRRFERHNLNIGVDIRIPIFSARTSAAVALARTDLTAAEIELKNKRSNLDLEVRRQARRTRELELGREVARLELQLAQENLRLLQAQFHEGRVGLRDLEKARLEESDKWMAFLDADFARQQAQLDLLRTTGQLAQVFQ